MKRYEDMQRLVEEAKRYLAEARIANGKLMDDYMSLKAENEKLKAQVKSLEPNN